MEPHVKRLLGSILLSFVLGSVGALVLTRWAECFDWDRACLIEGPQ
jgi:hypothetical protein